MPDRASFPTGNCRSIPTILREIETATATTLHAITQLVDAQQALLDRLYAEKRAAYVVAVHEPSKTPPALFEQPLLSHAEDRIFAQTR